MSKLTEAFEKYQITEKNISRGNYKLLMKTIEELNKLDKVLLLTCSNRFNWDENKIDVPKSTMLALVIQESLDNHVVLMDVPELKIYPCEGNVSRAEGNSCGIKKSLLKDDEKNPSGFHRCWASLNEEDDELWKISKELFESNAVVFFTSIRWGQASVFYQKLIERLTWIQNRHSTLGESNIVEKIQSGFICTGHNWKGLDVVDTQRRVHQFFGFKTNKNLYWNWQYTDNISDETPESYRDSFPKFIDKFKLGDLY